MLRHFRGVYFNCEVFGFLVERYVKNHCCSPTILADISHRDLAASSSCAALDSRTTAQSLEEIVSYIVWNIATYVGIET